MKKLILIALAVLFFSGCAAIHKPHWGYSGQEGPENWGALDPTFSACSCGKNQSPINIAGPIEGDLPPLAFYYSQGGQVILNNGHTVQVNYNTGSTISVSGRTFEHKQFHFHSPSENHINGISFPMEAHFVHADESGNLAVVAVMFKVGDSHPELEKAWRHMPEHAGEQNTLDETVSALELLPLDKDYYRFNGSLTTPPCTEGVWWLVMKESIDVSNDQIDAFSHILHHPNNRPLQPVNARIVLQ